MAKADPKNMPVAEPKDTTVDRALRTAESRRLIPQGEQGQDRPRGVKIKRKIAPNVEEAKRPETKPGKRDATGVSPEVERGQTVSQALLQGAAMVPQGFKGSQILQGLLGGAATGMQIDTALTQYKQAKKAQTAQNAATQMGQPVVQPPTPSNVPADVLNTTPVAPPGMPVAQTADDAAVMQALVGRARENATADQKRRRPVPAKTTMPKTAPRGKGQTY